VSGGRLRARYLEGSDGSREYVGWYDTEKQSECAFSKDTTGTVRCLPIHRVAAGSAYADASCTQIVLPVAYDSKCDVTAMPTHVVSGSCKSAVTVYQVLATHTTIYTYSGGCVVKPDHIGVEVDYGSPVPATEWVAATTGIE
jgi:hypothetical protein